MLPFSHGIAEGPAEAVVTAVARERGQSPLEMEPLLDVVDPDALNALFDGIDRRASPVRVTFDYCGEEVTVTADGVRVGGSDADDQ